jgi:hypothetical protein
MENEPKLINHLNLTNRKKEMNNAQSSIFQDNLSVKLPNQ